MVQKLKEGITKVLVVLGILHLCKILNELLK